MTLKLFLFFAMSVALARGQRPGFAGSKPIGYPEVYNRTTTTADGLGDRFGEGDSTTQRLPIEANGDRDLIDRLSKLPVDKQPFWFINWQALEANRNKPQSYPQKPNVFVDPVPNTGSQSGTTNREIPNSNSNSANSNGVPNRTNGVASTTGSNLGNRVTNLGTENRFGPESVSNVSSFTETNGASNSAVQNRFATESSESGLSEEDSKENHYLQSHRRFRPRNPIIDN